MKANETVILRSKDAQSPRAVEALTLLGRKIFVLMIWIVLCFIGCKENQTQSPLIISELGYQPSIGVDTKGIIRIAYGKGDSLLFSTSEDSGKTFSKEELIDTLHGLHLGMSRGPQISSSSNRTVIIAMNVSGDIYAYSLKHATNIWTKKTRVNDIPQIAKEGLSSIDSDQSDNFYATWLDLRDDPHNKIYVSHSAQGGDSWQKNLLVYRSPDGTVCECCRPSLAVSGSKVQIMFRNWLNGSRDMHVATSEDQALHFNEPIKLGTGTWKLKGCPMDGGAITVDSKGQTITTWRREGDVYISTINQVEQKMGTGRHSDMTSSGNDYAVTWSDQDQIYISTSQHPQPSVVGNGTYPVIESINNSDFFLTWESEGKIVGLMMPWSKK